MYCPLNPALDKHGGVMIPRRAAIDSTETLIYKANWTQLIFGELRILRQEVTLGAKNLQQFFVVYIFGLSLISAIL